MGYDTSSLVVSRNSYFIITISSISLVIPFKDTSSNFYLLIFRIYLEGIYEYELAGIEQTVEFMALRKSNNTSPLWYH